MGLGVVENHGNQTQEPQGQDKTHQSQSGVLVMDRNLPSHCKCGVRSATVQPGGASASRGQPARELLHLRRAGPGSKKEQGKSTGRARCALVSAQLSYGQTLTGIHRAECLYYPKEKFRNATNPELLSNSVGSLEVSLLSGCTVRMNRLHSHPQMLPFPVMPPWHT